MGAYRIVKILPSSVVVTGPAGRVTLKVEPVSFLKLITNQASGPGLFMTGKLKLEGDLMYAPQIATLFRIPAPPKQEGSN